MVCRTAPTAHAGARFSALQRAEIAEIRQASSNHRPHCASFSALQRAEIAEIAGGALVVVEDASFSALQRAEIAEIVRVLMQTRRGLRFQCSSTSRNC